MPRRRRVLIGVVVVAVVQATGCASGGGSGRSATSTRSRPPSTATSAPTRLPAGAFAPGRHLVSFEADGAPRTAVVVVPRSSVHPLPLVFVFHGHGGSGANIERKFGIEGLWPDAIVVYPDGLVGHEGITDPEGVRPGWQTRLGEDGDRDLEFYDSMLAVLRSKLPVDADRIYLMGHSNGSAFVSLLLNRRGDAIAATANISSQPSPRMLAGDPARSMFMSMGERDPIVPYSNQRRSIPAAEQKLGIDPREATVDGYLRSAKGTGGIELETYVYPGGHDPPPEVPRLVVEFFRRHTLSTG